MKKFEFDHLLIWDKVEKVLLIELDNKKDYEEVNSFVAQHIDTFNKTIRDV